ncbi:hypothetical protein BGX27_007031 [Mortierella sp. AM989]|nr:hypothetical protein BGX27_007031 [Mortierella sp. AM989]
MAAVSEFSNKMTRRFSSSTSPLTEANLYRHTITSPPTRDAKLKHILGYVEMQRELVALEEEMHRNVVEKGRWRNTISNNPTKSDLVLELHSSQLSTPHLRHIHQQQQQQQKEQFEDQHRQHPYQELPDFLQPAQQRSSKFRASQKTSTASALYPHQQHQRHQAPHPLDNVPGLDPNMALPRALPRNSTNQDQPYYRDSFYSGIGQENDWRQLENLDPDSLAGIHIYGDTTDFQLQPPSQVSPAAASSPLNKYPIYEYVPTKKRSTEWQQERHFQQLQQQAILRQLQKPDEEDDGFGTEIAARHQRHHSISLAQEQQRQLVSPPPTFVEKETKSGRFTSRFSFLTRRRQSQHQRHESVPTLNKEAWTSDTNSGHVRLYSPPIQSGTKGAVVAGMGESQHQGEEMSRIGTPTSKQKSGNRVKQMFKDVFGMSKKKNCYSPETAFRDISLPSTHIRSTMTPPPHSYHHQQHLDPSAHIQPQYSTAIAQRKGLVTPVSRPGTSQSHYLADSGNNINNNVSNIRVKKSARESLVDPIHVQSFGYQKMEVDGDEYDGYDGQDSNSVLLSPFAHTSLTPPPASSVLRHSTLSHRAFNNPAVDCEPILITSAAAGTDEFLPLNSVGGDRYKARRSSQLLPIPKDSIDSGCDSMGGHELYATASNATTLNHNQIHLVGQQQNPNSNLTLHQNQGPSSYDNDRRSTLTMTMSMYDNGPAIVSLGQVQKVDLEGLRQNHHHHSPSIPPPLPPHSHHLSMVAVEAPFA